MKRITYTLLTLFIATAMLASGPDDDKAPKPIKQKVYSIIKQSQSNEWYAAQAELWKAETEVNSKSTEAWLNYYTAKRMHKIMGGGTKSEDLEKIVAQVQKNIPGTYEDHYITGWNTHIGKDKIIHLEKAYAIDPDRPDVYDGMLTHYELTGNRNKVEEFCNKIFESNDISSQIYAWNYNMLQSVEEDAILLTAGDNDTYPAWILQKAQEIRPDITVLNISLLGVKDYQNDKFDELNINRFEASSGAKSYWESNFELCKHIRKNSNKPVYFAASINREIYNEFKEELYVVGLAFKWTEESFDNIAALRKNYEKHFLKDNLKINLFKDLSESVVAHMNGSYVMPLITLHNHYKETEEESKMNQVDLLLGDIAERAGNSEAVEDIINPPTNKVVSLVLTDPRDARYGFLKVNDTLEVSQTEVTESRYEQFLLDLLKQKRYDDLAIAKSEEVNWDKLLIPQYSKLSYEEYFNHGAPGSDNFPQVNVSYEAVVLYCEWLTNIYNKLEHRKKKYDKVKFRLPTEAEWMMMASAGHDPKYKYPWGAHNELGPKDVDTSYNHDQVQNVLGCYLANVQTNKPYGNHQPDDEKSCPVHDGGVFPVNSSSYHPNDFGLYCMIGNVAEMVAEKGIAKGGGWNTQPEDATIQAKQTYDSPNANVGFRIVMEIIEK